MFVSVVYLKLIFGFSCDYCCIVCVADLLLLYCLFVYVIFLKLFLKLFFSLYPLVCRCSFLCPLRFFSSMSGKQELTEVVDITLDQPQDYGFKRADGRGLKRPERSESDSDSGSGLVRFGDSKPEAESHGSGKLKSDGNDSLAASMTPDQEARDRLMRMFPEMFRITADLLTNLEPDEERSEAFSIFSRQLRKGQGFDFDFTQHKYNYGFYPVIGDEDWEDDMTAWEVVNECARMAIDQHNQETGKKLEFVKTVKANYEGAKGILLYITIQVKDCSSSDEDTQIYQAVVRMFGMDDVLVRHVRPKPPEGVEPPSLGL